MICTRIHALTWLYKLLIVCPKSHQFEALHGYCPFICGSEERSRSDHVHLWAFVKNTFLLATVAMMAQHGLRFTGPLATWKWLQALRKKADLFEHEQRNKVIWSSFRFLFYIFFAFISLDFPGINGNGKLFFKWFMHVSASGLRAKQMTQKAWICHVSRFKPFWSTLYMASQRLAAFWTIGTWCTVNSFQKINRRPCDSEKRNHDPQEKSTASPFEPQSVDDLK